MSQLVKGMGYKAYSMKQYFALTLICAAQLTFSMEKNGPELTKATLKFKVPKIMKKWLNQKYGNKMLQHQFETKTYVLSTTFKPEEDNGYKTITEFLCLTKKDIRFNNDSHKYELTRRFEDKTIETSEISDPEAILKILGINKEQDTIEIKEHRTVYGEVDYSDQYKLQYKLWMVGVEFSAPEHMQEMGQFIIKTDGFVTGSNNDDRFLSYEDGITAIKGFLRSIGVKKIYVHAPDNLEIALNQNQSRITKIKL